MAENITIEGFTFQGNAGHQVSIGDPPLFFERCAFVKVINNIFKDSTLVGSCRFKKCYDFQFRGNTIDNVNESYNDAIILTPKNYGCDSFGSESGTFVGNFFFNVRHAIQINQASGNDDEKGPSRNIVVDSNIARDCTSSPWNVHPNCELVSFVGNHAYSARFKEIDATAIITITTVAANDTVQVDVNSIDVSGIVTSADTNTTTFAAAIALKINELKSAPNYYATSSTNVVTVITEMSGTDANNFTLEPNEVGVTLTHDAQMGDTQAGAYTDPAAEHNAFGIRSPCVVANNSMHGFGTGIIIFTENTESGSEFEAICIGNKIDCDNGIVFKVLPHKCVISGNHIRCRSGTGISFSQDGSGNQGGNQSSVTNNHIEGYASPAAGSGIKLDGHDNMYIAGNYIRGFAEPISFNKTAGATESNQVIVGPNYFTGNTSNLVVYNNSAAPTSTGFYNLAGLDTTRDLWNFGKVNFMSTVSGGMDITTSPPGGNGVIGLQNEGKIAWRSSENDNDGTFTYNSQEHFSMNIDGTEEYEFGDANFEIKGNSLKFNAATDQNDIAGNVSTGMNYECVSGGDHTFAVAGTGNVVNVGTFGIDLLGNGAQNIGTLNLNDATILTIATAIITAVQSYHTVAAETGTTDTLSTVNGDTAGDILVLKADAGDTITVDNADNILLAGGTMALTANDTITLISDGTNWREMARSVNT